VALLARDSFSRLEAAWLATSNNRQDTLYHDRVLVGSLYCDCIVFKHIKLTSKQDKAKPLILFHFRAKNPPVHSERIPSITGCTRNSYLTSYALWLSPVKGI